MPRRALLRSLLLGLLGLALAYLGALVGAQVGLAGIPRRFVDGLEDHAALLALAARVAEGVGSRVR